MVSDQLLSTCPPDLAWSAGTQVCVRLPAGTLCCVYLLSTFCVLDLGSVPSPSGPSLMLGYSLQMFSYSPLCVLLLVPRGPVFFTVPASWTLQSNIGQPFVAVKQGSLLPASIPESSKASEMETGAPDPPPQQRLSLIPDPSCHTRAGGV